MSTERPPVDLARIGACPTCRAGLRPEKDAFACLGCGRRWPIVKGIPRFVDSEHYVQSFGYQWRRHRRTQLVDKSIDSETEFREKTGLTPETVRGKLVLDVGVGAGRFSDLIGRWGGTPVGVDLSLAVLSAQKTLAPYAPNAFVCQADAFHMPFKEESFDIVYSMGVLMATPSTRQAFRTIARFVKPGGIVATGLYEDFSDFLTYASRYRRYTTAMSHSLLHLLCYASIPIYTVLKVTRSIFGPVVTGQVEKALMIFMHEDPLWRVLGTFDWYAPRYQWLHEENEVKQWYEELGFEDVRRMPERTMVSVRGRRPASGPLKDPPPSDERCVNGPQSVPGWVPQSRALRDATLTTLLAVEVMRALYQVTRDIALHSLPRPTIRPLVTATVVATKHKLGIKRDLADSTGRLYSTSPRPASRRRNACVPTRSIPSAQAVASPRSAHANGCQEKSAARRSPRNGVSGFARMASASIPVAGAS